MLWCVVASATAHQSTAAFHAADHFASRQVFALILAAMVAIAFVELGPRRLLRAAPVTFACALLAAGAVFAPGVGVHAAGANRWLHVGPFSGNPAPLLTAATAMLMAAWSAPSRPTSDARAHVPLAVGLGALAVLTFVAEPDFSAAAITALVVLVALAGAGVGGRRLVPAAAATVIVLALVASRFGYVNGRVRGFLAPEADRRGKGFEVLALERAHASATRNGVGTTSTEVQPVARGAAGVDLPCAPRSAIVVRVDYTHPLTRPTFAGMSESPFGDLIDVGVGYQYRF